MPRLPKLTGIELAKILEKFGFSYDHTKGSHMVYRNQGGKKITIPRHAGEEIGPGLFTRIIKKDLQMTKDEFLKRLDKVSK